MLRKVRVLFASDVESCVGPLRAATKKGLFAVRQHGSGFEATGESGKVELVTAKVYDETFEWAGGDRFRVRVGRIVQVPKDLKVEIASPGFGVRVAEFPEYICVRPNGTLTKLSRDFVANAVDVQ